MNRSNGISLLWIFSIVWFAVIDNIRRGGLVIFYIGSSVRRK